MKLFLLGCFIVGLCTPAAIASGYLKLGEIQGESRASGTEGWIELGSLGTLIEQLNAGSGRSTLARHQPVTLSKRLNKASPLLAQVATTGKIIRDATIVASRGKGAVTSYFEIELGSVSLLSWKMDKDFSSDQFDETFTLEYETVDWLYRRFDGDSQVLEQVQVTWDVEAGVGGSESSKAPVLAPVSEVVVAQATEFDVEINISDLDTALEKLEVSAFSHDPSLVKVLAIKGSGATRNLLLQASSVRSGIAAIQLQLTDGAFEVSRSFSVVVGTETTPFEAYLAAYYTEEELEQSELISPIGDPDGDGIASILEFYLGTPPNAFTPTNEAINYQVKSTDDGLVGELKFWRRVDANLFASIAHSFDLENWDHLESGVKGNPLYEETATAAENVLYEQVSGTVTAPGAERSFVRIELNAVF